MNWPTHVLSPSIITACTYGFVTAFTSKILLTLIVFHTHTHTHARTHACTHACTHTHTRYVVGTVFGFEHLLLVVAVWLQWAIKPEPKWVRLAVARREYLARERRRGEYKEEEEGKQITEEERDKDD